MRKGNTNIFSQNKKTGKKVLIVDDNQDFLEALSEMLEQIGFKVIVCSDGERAFSQAIDNNPDIMLLDLRLGRISGFDVARKMKDNNLTASIPIIAMTGFYTNAANGRLKSKCGIHSCLIKPFNPLDVIVEIQDCLKGKSEGKKC